VLEVPQALSAELIWGLLRKGEKNELTIRNSKQRRSGKIPGVSVIFRSGLQISLLMF